MEMFPREPDDWGITAYQEPPTSDPLDLVRQYGRLGALRCLCKWSAPCHEMWKGRATCPQCGSRDAYWYPQ
jgi:hypothetical protein